VIAIFCGKLLEGEQPTIFGDGLQTRDYVFVGDVVRANLAASLSDATGAINIGTGVESSVLDLVEALAPQADGPFEAIMAPERPGEVRHIALDATRAGELLGWSAETGLGDGLAVTLDSLR
jgi:UDP-glucose 4-epimerase